MSALVEKSQIYLEKFRLAVQRHGLREALRMSVHFLRMKLTPVIEDSSVYSEPVTSGESELEKENFEQYLHSCRNGLSEENSLASKVPFSSPMSEFEQYNIVNGISVLIPTIGKFKALMSTIKKLVDSLIFSGVDFEILISIDVQASRENQEFVKDVVAHFDSNRILIVSNFDSHGFGPQVNLLSARATRNLLFIMNDDILCDLKLFANLLQSNRVSPSNIVCPVVLNTDGTIQEAGSFISKSGRAEWIGSGHHIEWLSQINQLKVDFASACTWLIFRETFEKFGGFTGFAGQMYFEDLRFACDPTHQLNTYVITSARATHELSSSNSASYKRTIVDKIVKPIFQEWWQEHQQINRCKELQIFAFYLPQYYETAYNNDWWGSGYTEWTAVARSRRFIRNQGPKLIPSELGFYNLENVATLESQSRLAKHYGIDVLVVMTYWFKGERLLEVPLESFLIANLDTKFILYWANEPWTRRWDGQNQEVLIEQEHSVEDSRNFIRFHKKFFESPKYFRYRGRPVLFIYRRDLFGDVKANIAAMRQITAELGLGELYICILESFGDSMKRSDPREDGFDASVEYPPHGSFTFQKFEEVSGEQFHGRVHDYRELMSHYVCRPVAEYPIIKGVAVGFDNSPRLQSKSTIFEHATPNNFSRWVKSAISSSLSYEEDFPHWVAINAWNEWGESAVLEPSTHFGREYLELLKVARDTYQETTVDIRHE